MGTSGDWSPLPPVSSGVPIVAAAGTPEDSPYWERLGGWGDRDEVTGPEVDQMYNDAEPGTRDYNPIPGRPAPLSMYHITKSDPQKILSEGLNWDERQFAPVGDDFNPPGVYLYDNIDATRRLFPRSTTHIFKVNTQGLPLVPDEWGGLGAWRSTEPISPDRLEHIHTYEPFDKPLKPTYHAGAVGEDSPYLLCPQCRKAHLAPLYVPGERPDSQYGFNDWMPDKMWNPQLVCPHCGFKTSVSGEDNQIGTPYTDAERNQMWQDVVTSPNRDPMFINPQNWDFGQRRQGAKIAAMMDEDAIWPGSSWSAMSNEGHHVKFAHRTLKAKHDDPNMLDVSVSKPNSRYDLCADCGKTREAHLEALSEAHEAARWSHEYENSPEVIQRAQERGWPRDKRSFDEHLEQAKREMRLHGLNRRKLEPGELGTTDFIRYHDFVDGRRHHHHQNPLDDSSPMVPANDEDYDMFNYDSLKQAYQNGGGDFEGHSPGQIWSLTHRPEGWEFYRGFYRNAPHLRTRMGPAPADLPHFAYDSKFTLGHDDLDQMMGGLDAWHANTGQSIPPINQMSEFGPRAQPEQGGVNEPGGQIDWEDFDKWRGSKVAHSSGHVTGMTEDKWEGLVKRACKIAEDDGIDVAGDFLFEASGEIELSADFMRQFARVFEDGAGVEVGRNVRPEAAVVDDVPVRSPEVVTAGAELADTDIPVNVSAPAPETEPANDHSATLAKLTDLVAQLAEKPAEAPEKKRLVVKRDDQGRIASIEEA